MQTIQITDGQNKPINLVSGLEWHPLKEVGMKRAAEIRKIAKKQGFDLKIVRSKPEGSHVGFARAVDGAKLGFVSLAACVCEKLAKGSAFGAADNVLVAVRLPIEGSSNWAFISSRDGVILADGDFSADEISVRDRLRSDANFAMGWDAVICPANWEIPRSVDHDFNYFFETEQRALLSKLALAEIFVSTRLYWLAGAAVAAGVLVAAGLHYMKRSQESDLAKQEEAAQLAAIEASNQQNGIPLVPVPPALSEKDASVHSLAVACDAALRSAKINAGQWALSTVECDVTGLKVSWAKGNATIAELVRDQPGAYIGHDGLTALIIVPVQGVEKPTEEYEEFWPRNAIALAQKMRSETFGHDYKPGSMTSVPPSPPTPGKPGVAASGGLSFEASAYLDTPDLANLIDGPGLRAQRIVYTFGEGIKKTIFGVQYGK
jgi:hypothetical protein